VIEERRQRPTSGGVPLLRSALAVLAVLLWIAFLVPPMSGWSGKYEFMESLQFGIFAFVVPALVVSGAQWRRLGVASLEAYVVDEDGAVVSPRVPRLVDRIAITRSKSSHQRRAVLVAVFYGALTIVWRMAPVVDSIVRHRWLVIVEALSLLLVGVPMFSNLIESPPMKPGTMRPYRIGISAGVMWVAWVISYLDGMSHTSWYHAFHHVAGRGVSLAADQQISAATMWFVSGAVFIPIIFWNLIHWLQSDEDPNEELQKLVRVERTRGFFGSD